MDSREERGRRKAELQGVHRSGALISKLSYEVVSRPPLDWVLVLGFIIMIMFIMIMFIISANIIVPITIIVVIVVILIILHMFTTVATLAGNRPVAGCPGAGAPSVRSAPCTRPGALLIWTSAAISWTTTSATFSDRA